MGRTMFVLLVVIVLYSVLIFVNYSYTLSVRNFSFELNFINNQNKIYDFNLEDFIQEDKKINIEEIDLI